MGRYKTNESEEDSGVEETMLCFMTMKDNKNEDSDNKVNN